VTVRLFGRDVFELGGTRNQQSRWARRVGFQQFLHVELAAATRLKLNRDPALRQSFREALVGPPDIE